MPAPDTVTTLLAGALCFHVVPVLNPPRTVLVLPWVAVFRLTPPAYVPPPTTTRERPNACAVWTPLAIVNAGVADAEPGFVPASLPVVATNTVLPGS